MQGGYEVFTRGRSRPLQGVQSIQIVFFLGEEGALAPVILINPYLGQNVQKEMASQATFLETF